MKNVTLFLLLLTLGAQYDLVAQSEGDIPLTPRKDQSVLYNDVFAGYGLGSLYFWSNQDDSRSYAAPGTFFIGYQRSLGKVISVGFQASFTPINSEYKSTNSYNYYYSEKTDNYWQGIANIKFSYLNKPMFRMYSGVGLGVTMDYYTETVNGTTTKGQRLLPAGQMTFLGFRVGRALSGFGEFGIGTNGIIIVGMSYRFSD
jgi:hypothetical protein